MNATEVDAAIQHVWPDQMPPGMKVFAILDAARNEKIYPAVTACNLPWLCLYLGDIPQELAQVAPYLIELKRDDPFTKTMIGEGWTDHWGIFLWAPAALDDLRRHLRKFLTVKDEAGKQLVFRYYDPRVLRAYLPTCTPDELETLFGPVHEFIAPGPEPSAAKKFRLEEGRLIQQ